MDELNDEYESYIKMDFEERVLIAKDCLESLKKYAKKKKLTPNQLGEITWNYFKMFVCVDGLLDANELDLFNAIFQSDVTEEEFIEELQGGNDLEFIDQMKEFTDSLKDKVRYDLIIFGICILTADGHMGLIEKELINYLLLKEKKKKKKKA